MEFIVHLFLPSSVVFVLLLLFLFYYYYSIYFIVVVVVVVVVSSNLLFIISSQKWRLAARGGASVAPQQPRPHQTTATKRTLDHGISPNYHSCHRDVFQLPPLCPVRIQEDYKGGETVVDTFPETVIDTLSLLGSGAGVFRMVAKNIFFE